MYTCVNHFIYDLLENKSFSLLILSSSSSFLDTISTISLIVTIQHITQNLSTSIRHHFHHTIKFLFLNLNNSSSFVHYNSHDSSSMAFESLISYKSAFLVSHMNKITRPFAKKKEKELSYQSHIFFQLQMESTIIPYT